LKIDSVIREKFLNFIYGEEKHRYISDESIFKYIYCTSLTVVGDLTLTYTKVKYNKETAFNILMYYLCKI